MRKQVTFKTNARHISQLGRELVTDFVTALVELVKNSYDADASGVKIIFDNVKKSNGKIIFIDTGKGMTIKDIEDKWTVIGTNNKVRENYSDKGRKLAGKKGIGRFSVERLAESVKIYSFSKEDEPFKFSVNWNKYEEIDIVTLSHRIAILKHDTNNISSAKYLKSHIDYFLNNENVKLEHKKIVMDKILQDNELKYTLFLDNPIIIKRIEEYVVPVLKIYQNEEIRISDIKNDIEDLKGEERAYYQRELCELYKELNIIDNQYTGIIMVLEDLRDSWKQKDLEKLQKELRILVSPYFLDNDPFKVLIDASEFTLQHDILMNNILELNYAKIKATSIKDGAGIMCTYTNKFGDSKTFSEDFNTPLVCGEVSLELYYFVRDQANLSNKLYNVTHARGILDEFCGIKVYRDGFRVKPYGDQGNDWLLLDLIKIKETHDFRVGNNQVIGIVRISEKSNPLLIDATNREGIIENQAFEDLKKFVLFCTDYISNVRYMEYQAKKEKDRILAEEERKRREDEIKKAEEEERQRIRERLISSKTTVITKLIDNIKSTPEVKRVLDITKELQKETEDEVIYYRRKLEEERRRYDEFHQKTKQIFNETIEDKEKELNLYKNLASLGILTGAFGHETKDVISRSANNIQYTRLNYPETAFTNDIEETYEDLEMDFKRIHGYGDLIVSFLKKKKRDQLEYLNFKEVINDVTKIYKYLLITQKIDLELDLDDFMSEVQMFRIDLESIIINMVTNSYEALKTRLDRKIKISAKIYEGYYEMIFEDNGEGIRKGSENLIFLPFKTTKEDGIGLGLNIVKDIVTRYNGEISVRNSVIHGGAIFTVKFPRGDINE